MAWDEWQRVKNDATELRSHWLDCLEINVAPLEDDRSRVHLLGVD